MIQISDIKAAHYTPENDEVAQEESESWASNIDVNQRNILREQYLEATIHRYQQELEHAREDQKTRRIILLWFIWTFSILLSTTFLCVILSGFQEEQMWFLPAFDLSDKVLIALSAGIITGMIGLIAIPLRYMFSHKKT